MPQHCTTAFEWTVAMRCPAHDHTDSAWTLRPGSALRNPAAGGTDAGWAVVVDVDEGAAW
jgi:hypothetical protein